MIKTVGIIGAGTMGFGIAFQFAINGTKVILNDLSEEILQVTINKFDKYLDIFRRQGFDIALTNEEVYKNVQLTTSLMDLKDCQLIIETASENLEVKQAIFKELDNICSENTILASNTSSLRLSDIVVHVEKHRSKVLLTHFFNPAHIVPLVEMLKNNETEEKVYTDVKTFLESQNKVTIEVKREVAGLVANRIQVALAREALALLEDGVVSKEDLETALFAGPGFRFSSSGLLKIIDFGGLDIWNIVLDQLQPKVESSVRDFCVIKDRVQAGNIGVKSGKGFFEYPGKGFDSYVVERDESLVRHLLNTNPRLGIKSLEVK
ncbi:3-hydroxyacyl-CoA dehydrogenase family protein [Viridibacillus arvi]|uniref:3-hydroxybutyryl-CoA dehydrogenase n=1 Tax=Viridibacillus arvi TaxID=263475 RepID=A0A0M0LMH4_9BACL|nr:3-hydroxyacyl-CoA dehydrogenase family protein [Viridibacillus arvi]KOO52201.1 hypothetical protein AMD00_07285 [Viridibacillus arvi]